MLTTTWDDNNHLYGGQIGSEMEFWKCNSPLRITGEIKAGAFANMADNEFRANGIYANSNANDSELAFAGEVDFMASYQLTCHCAIHGGYQVLWLDNLALSSNNAANAAAAGSTAAAIDTSATLVYNGPPPVSTSCGKPPAVEHVQIRGNLRFGEGFRVLGGNICSRESLTDVYKIPHKAAAP